MDAKSLLRAKKAEARINHPYAAYNAAGVLRCAICAVPVKQWDAHLLTKQHRTSVSREKAEREKAQAQAAAKAQAQSSKSKRAAEGPASASNGSGVGEESLSKRARISKAENGSSFSSGSALPAGFFSAGNGPLTLHASDDEDEGDDQQEAGPSSTSALTVAAASGPPAPTGDSELDDFLSSLNQDDNANSSAAPLSTAPTTVSAPTTAAGRRKTYKEVIPGQASYEAAPVRIVQDPPSAEGANGQQQEEEAELEESEQERRERLEREEREEIVRRLEEEERAQEDADSRVASLKARMEMIKRRREARGGGSKASSKKASAEVGTNGA
ncbi:hypothetical protein I316_03867 [Kwoniella heveanensis BCC8398]|uniref:Zinc finger protein 830 n=1 Tax=Kwoniella heveanensis BCC8398 TaxID=1296120 RepID=A0A1B9GTL2_9TREE|nr:hypothetical protein I316_03867 [Kwoniella heveanensis BCC8398]